MFTNAAFIGPYAPHSSYARRIQQVFAGRGSTKGIGEELQVQQYR